jgi:hypothetical protein
MDETFPIRCPNCQALYELPESLRKDLTGKSLDCVDCATAWVPLPASGLMAKLLGKAGGVLLDMTLYHKGDELLGDGTAELHAEPPEPAAPEPAAPEPDTPEPDTPEPDTPEPDAPEPEPEPDAPEPDAPEPDAPEPEPEPEESYPPVIDLLCLKIFAYGPELDDTTVHSLGTRSFFIGRQGCHLNLPQAPIPDRAIRVWVDKGTLAFEGIDGFDIPLAQVSVQTGHVKPNSSMSFRLVPYQVVLEQSSEVGQPIADLGGGTPRASDIRSQLRPAAGVPAAGVPAAGVPAAGVPAAGVPVGTETVVGSETVLDAGASAFANGQVNPVAGYDVTLFGLEGPYKDKIFRVKRVTS